MITIVFTNTYHEKTTKRMKCVSIAIAQFIERMF